AIRRGPPPPKSRSAAASTGDGLKDAVRRAIRPLEAVLAELDGMIGWASVKAEVHKLVAVLNPTFSTEGARGGKWLSNQGWGAEGLHYMADCGCCVAGSGAAILGGGCGGRARPRRCRRSFWSTSGSVYRLMISVRPSVVGKWTSSIWMPASLSSTARGVRPAAIGRSLARSVTCRQ